jgi:peptide/nickel transport system permease protein
VIKYILKKTAYAAFILWSVVTVVFWLFHSSFPSADELLVTDRTDAATLQAIKSELKQDESSWDQYISFLDDLSPVTLKGRSETVTNPVFTLPLGSIKLVVKAPYFRRSFETGRFTFDLIRDAFLGTAILALVSILLASVLGIAFGVLAGVNRGKALDQFLLFVSTLGISVPSFFSAIVLGWLFAYVYHDYTGLDLTGSLHNVDPFHGRYIAWKNLILPALALGIRPLAIITQLTRNSMIDTLGKDYIRTARSKGLSKFRIYTKHALRAALIPVLTSISGWFASLLAGAFFVEYIFGWERHWQLDHSRTRSERPTCGDGLYCSNFRCIHCYQWVCRCSVFLVRP